MIGKENCSGSEKYLQMKAVESTMQRLKSYTQKNK